VVVLSVADYVTVVLFSVLFGMGSYHRWQRFRASRSRTELMWLALALPMPVAIAAMFAGLRWGGYVTGVGCLLSFVLGLIQTRLQRKGWDATPRNVRKAAGRDDEAAREGPRI